MQRQLFWYYFLFATSNLSAVVGCELTFIQRWESRNIIYIRTFAVMCPIERLVCVGVWRSKFSHREFIQDRTHFRGRRYIGNSIHSFLNFRKLFWNLFRGYTIFKSSPSISRDALLFFILFFTFFTSSSLGSLLFYVLRYKLQCSDVYWCRFYFVVIFNLYCQGWSVTWSVVF